MNKITYLSPAKINLTLDVKAKTSGADFHEIDTVFHRLDWGDEITLEPSEKFEITGDFDCALEDNLIYQAWQLIQKQAPHPRVGEDPPQSSAGDACLRRNEGPQAVKVTVKKRIPTGAGLGGGSSNAATFVQAYHDLVNLGAVSEPMTAALAELGKDIPFFLSGAKCARGTHYGEAIEPLNLNFSGTPLYLYLPDFKHPTAWAYDKLKKFSTNYTQNLIKSGNLNDCGNSFDQFFEQKSYSKLNTLSKEKTIIMSGSGSAFFSFQPLDIDYRCITTTLA